MYLCHVLFSVSGRTSPSGPWGLLRVRQRRQDVGENVRRNEDENDVQKHRTLPRELSDCDVRSAGRKWRHTYY